MFSKAIQDHNPTLSTGLKGTTLSQHYKATGNVLKPVTPTSLNSSPLSWAASTNPLKRSASQANTRNQAYVNQENSRNKRAMVDLTQLSSGGGRVGKLHNTVYFDENDFDDDATIDLDEDVSRVYHRPSPATSSETLLPDTILTKPTAPRTPASSTPLPWSSSPTSHYHNQPANENIKEAPLANKIKRRTLPWVEEEKREAARARERLDQAYEGLKGGYSRHDKDRIRKTQSKSSNKTIEVPDLAADTIVKAKEGKGAGGVQGEAYTPLPKDKISSPYPWNKTASALKEEQKKLRQGHRKLVKDHEGPQAAKSNTKKKRESVARVFLSDEQKSVLNLVAQQGKSVFFTGSAGTGKSVLLRETIKILRDKFKREPDRVAVTASTGLAACNVGGVTLHSFAGIGLGKEPVPELVKKIKRNQKARNRWMRTKVLVIDEISMVDGDLFDKLEALSRAIRSNGRPFGGIQLVITGDFFQLPPVPDYGRVSKFSFDASTWNTSIEHTIGLTQVFRQKDPAFANMLNEMRLGKLTPKSIHAFQSLSRPLSFADDFEATELFPTRNEVEHANGARMRNLSGKDFEFRAEDGGMIQDITQRSKLLENCMAPASITLKKGAQVMLIKNIDDTLVNGSVGKVIAFMDEKTFDIYHEDEDEFQATANMALDDEEMTKSRMKLKALINKDLASDTSQKWPLVRFQVADGTSRDLLCQRESWKIELPNGEIQASRSQVPLILAWALSIHKAQGQTLDRVKVDLGKIFEKGQAYVALSRATCQEGLQITRFDPKKVMAHDRVRTFYDSLYSIDQATRSRALAGAEKKETDARGYENDFLNAGFGPEEDDDAMHAMYGR